MPTNHSISLEELCKQAVAYHEDTVDYYTDVKSLLFNQTSSLEFTPGADAPLFAGSEVRTNLTLNDNAHRQIVERLHGPNFAWVNGEFCPSQLHNHIMNERALIEKNDTLLVRAKKDYARAVLSKEYSIMDFDLIVPMVMTTFELAAQAANTSLEVQVFKAVVGDFSRAYLLLPQMAIPGVTNTNMYHGREVGGLHPALYMSDNEIGAGKAIFNPGAFRSVCSNGTIMGWQSKEQAKQELWHRWVKKAVLQDRVAQAVTSALQLSIAACQIVFDSIDVEIDNTGEFSPLAGLITTWATNNNFTKQEAVTWKTGIEMEAASHGHASDIRLFDVANSLTAMAQLTTDVKRQEELESMSGDLLTSFFKQVKVEALDALHIDKTLAA